MQEVPARLPEISSDIWSALRTDTRPLLMYGMGNGAEKLLVQLGRIGRRPDAVFASDEFVRGQSFRGYPVMRFREALRRYPDGVILQAFATRDPSVLAHVYDMAETYDYRLPDMPVAGDTLFDAAFYAAHRGDLQRVYDLLGDNLSKMIFSEVVAYKLNGRIHHLRRAVSRPADTVALLCGRTFRTVIDAGAYRGDTAGAWLSAFPKTECVLAVEPDARNFAKLETYAASEQAGGRVRPVRAVLLDRPGEVRLAAGGNRNSTLFGASYAARTEMVPATTIDAMAGSTRIDLIKYDVEGAEEAALQGSRQTILRDRPVLAVSLYHRTEDLFNLPLFIRQIREDYRFYIRRAECLPAWELMLYAV